MKESFSLEFLKRCENVTREHEKIQSWGINDQLLKIYEEVAEVQQAHSGKILSSDKILEETCDVILASLTLLHKWGYPPEIIQQSMEKTLHKVESRIPIHSNDFVENQK